MKRRGFLGFLGGAAVAGPSMAKQAVTMSDTLLGSVSGASPLVGGGFGVVSSGSFPPDQSNFALQLASLLGRTAAQHREFMARQHVTALDPDISEYRAIRLQAKISMQRERDYWRGIANEKSWLQRAAEGLF